MKSFATTAGLPYTDATAGTPGARHATHHPGAPPGHRIASLDVIRGAVMILMALDHVRVYISGAGVNPTDLGATTVPLFLTRWITHVVAPAFLFLAGTGTFLHAQKLGRRRALARFLAVRGVWLVLIELTVVRLAWTFNVDYAHYLLAGVIWMIGWCMVLMAPLVLLPIEAVGAFGLAIIFGHNLLDGLLPRLAPAIQASHWTWLLQILYLGGPVHVGRAGPVLAVLFSIVPWVGVMAAGYAFGPVMRWEPPRRRRISLYVGLGAVALFLVLRGFNLYGNTPAWSVQRTPAFTVLSFLNTRKYPASLLFLLMTLGPTIALIPALEGARGVVARVCTTLGRVPFFYYVLHIPTIHLAAVILSLVRYGSVIPWLTDNQPMMAPEAPEGYGYGLPVVYLVTAIVVAVLYVPCRWFATVKARRTSPWLSYL
jgi:uncharacterized membrane protein